MFSLLSRFGHFPDLVENQAKTSLPEAVWLYSNLTPTAPCPNFFCLKVAFRDAANEFSCRGNLSGLATWMWALGRTDRATARANMNDAPTFADRAPGDTESQVFSQDYDSLSLPNANVMKSSRNKIKVTSISMAPIGAWLLGKIAAS